MKKDKDQGEALWFVSPYRKAEEEERIQNSNKGREEGGKPESGDLTESLNDKNFRVNLKYTVQLRSKCLS